MRDPRGETPRLYGRQDARRYNLCYIVTIVVHVKIHYVLPVLLMKKCSTKSWTGVDSKRAGSLQMFRIFSTR